MTASAIVDRLHESRRLAALKRYLVLDSGPETAYDDITRMVAETLKVPIALINILDSDRDWFKSRRGTLLTSSPRSTSFCAYLLTRPDEVAVIPDTHLHPQFKDHPMVTGEPFVRFYAGAPIVTADRMVMGTVCAYDFQPRSIATEQISELAALASDVMALLERRIFGS